MLILTRKAGQFLTLIDKETNAVIAEIQVVEIEGKRKQVRIGITADNESVGIHRKEVYQKIQQQQ